MYHIVTQYRTKVIDINLSN